MAADQGEIDAKFEASYECYGEEMDARLTSNVGLHRHDRGVHQA
jgi:hypothetical protein